MLRSLKILLAATLLAALAGAGYAAWYVSTPVAIGTLAVEFEIPQGMPFRGAAQRLEEAGVAVGAWRFELLARALGRANDIKAGSYELGAPPTPLELLDKLTRGDVTQAEVKVIEGWTFRQMRAALDAHPAVRHDTADLPVAELLRRLGAQEDHPEGLFYPDTYLFSKGTSDLRILRRAHAALRRHLEQEWRARDPGVPYRSAYEALIMASIVEKETGRASERDRIGGVLANRLRLGMLLQVDPAVIYGLGESFDGNLKKIHLLADGPYNSYTRAGLPPTPIALPGLAALRAALHPAKTGALYYVARGDGSSEFSRTLEEHNRAVRKYQLNGAR
ncbi:MAG: aminodeoxychorismate lyase [Betaproteobacteria bacterium RIFCSPLOWO2_12_FULL_67_28]|nr:MAG: aminodeoxychorismate lyase [Betaproteobacteria bacterium RIFCSPLOWO2_02_FULL_68_150]OGA55375.1 MAG: aminodeoxychorismate lyase [Betaproteobacteria bacterium RIFCSPLOWO2_12_FULL_67_28]